MMTKQLIQTAALLSLLCNATLAGTLGTAITYQGKLSDAGNPANGSYDLKFTLYDAASAGGAVGQPLTNSPQEQQ